MKLTIPALQSLMEKREWPLNFTVVIGTAYRYRTNPRLVLHITGASRAENYVKLGSDWGWSWKGDADTFINQWETCS